MDTLCTAVDLLCCVAVVFALWMKDELWLWSCPLVADVVKDSTHATMHIRNDSLDVCRDVLS